MTLDHDNCFFSQKCWFSVLENSSLAKKKKKKAFEEQRSISLCWRNDRFWLIVARSCNLKNLWYLIADYFFIADFFTADSFLTADFFLTADYLALNDFYQSFFVLNAIVIIVIENEDICLSHITLLSSEFEELVCCSKRFRLCRKTRDKYWISNSTYNCFY
jgi:hypothetical protein